MLLVLSSTLMTEFMCQLYTVVSRLEWINVTESSCLVILETLWKATWKILHHLVGIIKAKGESHSSPFYLKLISSVSGKFRGRLRISICQDTIGIMLVKQTESDKFLKARNVFLFLINNFRKIFKIICFSNSPVWRSTKN